MTNTNWVNGSEKKFNDYRLKKILESNGFTGAYKNLPSIVFYLKRRETDPASLEPLIKEKFNLNGFEKLISPHWTMIYGLNNNDNDFANFYSPGFTDYYSKKNPIPNDVVTLNDIVNVSRKASKSTGIQVVSLYVSGRFAIPELQVFEHGKLVRASEVDKSRENYVAPIIDSNKKDTTKIDELYSEKDLTHPIYKESRVLVDSYINPSISANAHILVEPYYHERF